jgi:hypothetical protein
LRLAQEELKARADVFTLDALAWALQAAGRPQEVRTYSLRALSEGTQDARLFYHARGVIAALVDQKEEAARWFTQAAAIRQMLLPSEQEHLAKGSAQLTSAETTLASSQSKRREPLSKPHDYFIRRVL